MWLSVCELTDKNVGASRERSIQHREAPRYLAFPCNPLNPRLICVKHLACCSVNQRPRSMTTVGNHRLSPLVGYQRP
jgi:hypothetical protein